MGALRLPIVAAIAVVAASVVACAPAIFGGGAPDLGLLKKIYADAAK